MSTAVRDTGVAINWRVTLLGLNLAAWLVAALIVAVLFVHREMSQPPLYPGFGYSIPMFNDLPTLYPMKAENEPVVGLKGVGALGPVQHQLGPATFAPHNGKALATRQLGTPKRLPSPEDPRAFQQALQPPAH
jgi:hypothetical protein